ncbi:MAG: Pyridoxine 5'-phosphate synthase [Cellvibrionales bacterium UBA7375]|nr:MAG: Pyridoxine 5'-phosphate synthase [Cellvibrionales bacterium UBA7375]|tara:strand:- start:1420 stop:2166 length:747 start_codon:yes stop_codon:yes gene_type:complete
MTALSINLNKIALIRNSRVGNFPNILDFAETCIDCGVDGITVHPRPDQRHIRPNDVRQLAQLVAPLKEVEFNIEGNPLADPLGEYPGLLSLVEETLPEQCTLVPDSDSQLTSDHGFDLESQGDRLKPIIAQIKSMGVRVSLFMDPDLEQIKLASKVGADRIELYTGPYAAAWGTEALEAIFEQHFNAAELASSLGLGVNAGHDLNLINLDHYASIPDLLEVSIGHAFTVDSLNMGMVPALRAYQALLA